jgi:hypothetical protein
MIFFVQGENIIVVIPPEEWWWELALKDGPNPHIALLHMHPELRVKFNFTTTWECALSTSGMRYDYHRIIFSWINTIAHSRYVIILFNYS